MVVRCCSPVIVLSILLLWRPSLSWCELFDQSTIAFCPGAEFPRPGQRVCYRREIAPNKCNILNCTVDTINRSQGDIVLQGNSFRIASPRFYRDGGTYQNRRLCQYNIQSCPAGSIAHLQLLQPSFDLEPATRFGTVGLCLDYVKLFNVNLNLELDLLNNLCEFSGDFTMRLSGLPLQVEFRSDTGERFRGFRLDVVCSPTESSLVNRVMKRRRRDVEEGGEESGETARVQMGAESRHRTLRTTKCTVGYRMTETNCTEVIDFSQAPPTPPPPAHLPQKGNRVSIPLSAVLLYSDKVLQVVQGGIVLRRICQVTRLIFWTGFNGTRIFTGSAPVPQGEIFGGGVLLLYGGCAYYSTFASPPRFEPNSKELMLIATLTNATEPFFANQDIDDDDDPLPTAPPSTYKIPPTTDPGYDPRVDQEALEIAFEFENACNIFLRQAARSFLEILVDEGLLPAL